MYSLNKAMILGNVTRDPEVRTTPQGTTVTSFSVATNESWKDAQGNKQDRAEYHNVVAWRKLAEIIGQYVKKGSKVYVEGRIQTRDWEGQDGVKRYRTEIVADNLIMLDSKTSGGSKESFSAPSQSFGGAGDIPVITQEMPTSQNSRSNDEIDIEDIPF